MENNFQTHNLSISGIEKELFNEKFYSGSCEKINFKGVIKENVFHTKDGMDYISLAPKFIPHSDYELMLQSTDSICKSPITSLSDEAVRYILDVGYEFIDFIGSPNNASNFGMLGGYPYLVYNYDEFTTDRHSGMSKKPFHLHLNSWKKSTIQTINPIHKEEVSTFYYQSVVDPIFDITQTLAKEALECRELENYIKPVNLIAGNQEVYYSAIYEVVDGWRSLRNPDFVDVLKTIHKKLEERYIEILECFCGTNLIPKEYTRHILLPESNIRKNIDSANLQDATKSILIGLIDKLTSITPEQFQKISKNTNYRDTLISLRWLAYSIGLFSNHYIGENDSYVDQPMFMNVTPRLFTKIGGASIMNFPQHALVKIDRGKGNISNEDFSKRLSFHKEFTKSIK